MKLFAFAAAALSASVLKPSRIHFVLPPVVSTRSVGVTRLKPVTRVPALKISPDVPTGALTSGIFRDCPGDGFFIKLTFRVLSEPLAFSIILILSASFRSVRRTKSLPVASSVLTVRVRKAPFSSDCTRLLRVVRLLMSESPVSCHRPLFILTFPLPPVMAP